MSFITSPGVIVPPLTAGGVAYGTGGQAKVTSAGTAGQFLQSAGAGVPIWADAGAVIRVPRTSNTVLVKTNNSNLIEITSGTFTQTFAAAATLGDGWFCYLQNSGTGDITLNPDGAELIDGLANYIMYPNEVRLVQCNGTEFNSVVLSPFYRAFITSSTFTKPPGYFYFDVALWGGGGGAGRSNQSTGGGAGGAFLQGLILSSTVGTTETVTVGAGGTGGAGSSVSGTDGGSSTFVTSTATGGAGSISYNGLDTAGGAGASILPYSTSTLREGYAYQGGKAGLVAADTGGSAAKIAGYSEYGGGGGGGACAGTGPYANWGGGSFYGGGGGGGGQRASASNPNGYGGVSQWGGSGGVGGTDSTAGTAGTAPGGGGGGAGIDKNGGNGARGEVRIIGVA